MLLYSSVSLFFSSKRKDRRRISNVCAITFSEYLENNLYLAQGQIVCVFLSYYVVKRYFLCINV